GRVALLRYAVLDCRGSDGRAAATVIAVIRVVHVPVSSVGNRDVAAGVCETFDDVDVDVATSGYNIAGAEVYAHQLGESQGGDLVGRACIEGKASGVAGGSIDTYPGVDRQAAFDNYAQEDDDE